MPNYNVAVNCPPFLQYGPHDNVVEILPYAVCERIVLSQKCLSPHEMTCAWDFSAKVPESSSADVRMGLLIEPTHMEVEDKEQENEKEDERDCEEHREEVEEYQNNNTMRMIHG